MRLANFVLCAINYLLIVEAVKKVPLPPEFKSCKRESEDFSSCLRLAIQGAWPSIVKGMPEFEIPTLDPYEINDVETVYENGEVRGKVTVKNAMTYGALNHQFLSVKPHIDGDRFNMEVDVKVPKLFVEGDYKASGYISAFRMGGKGGFNISIEGIRTHFGIEGHVENDRWVIEHFRITPEISNMRVWFNDLFNGNEELNQAALNFCNEYWPILFRGMLPYVSEVMDGYFTEFANRVFSKISFSELFP